MSNTEQDRDTIIVFKECKGNMLAVLSDSTLEVPAQVARKKVAVRVDRGLK